jgi:DNA-directed RNA polymerase subunit RPC12/RpoP
MREDLKKEVEEKLSFINNTFKQSDIDLKVYATADECEEEKLDLYKCPECGDFFSNKLGDEDYEKLQCPSCETEFKIEREKDDTK